MTTDQTPPPEIRCDPNYVTDNPTGSLAYYQNGSIYLNHNCFTPLSDGGCGAPLSVILSHEYLHHWLNVNVCEAVSGWYDRLFSSPLGGLEDWVAGLDPDRFDKYLEMVIIE